MKNSGMLVSAILMVAVGIAALVIRATVHPTFINASLLSGLLLYVGLLLVFFGLLVAVVAFVKGPEK
jgi:hypothetical protein